MESSNRRLTLLEQMSAVDGGRTSLAAAFALDAILGNANKRPLQPPSNNNNRTLLEIILDDESNEDKESWKAFQDKIRFKRPASGLTSSVHVPDTDDDVHRHRDGSQLLGSGSLFSDLVDSTRVVDGGERAPVSSPPVLESLLELVRRDSLQVGHNPTLPLQDSPANVSVPSDGLPSRRSWPQTNRDESDRLPSSNTAVNDIDSSDDDDDSPIARHVTRQLGAVLAEERALSAIRAAEQRALSERETTVQSAPSAREDAEHTATAVSDAPLAAEEPVRMSLMELLEETNRQMELTGSSYIISDDDEKHEEEEEEEEVIENRVGMEHACCVCMVRHKGAAFIPCGHTFCRLCSRELWVQRGNCPLCNGSILEILDIF